VAGGAGDGTDGGGCDADGWASAVPTGAAEAAAAATVAPASGSRGSEKEMG